MTRYLLMPFRSTPLILVVIFSIGGVAAGLTGIFGIPLALILVSWFFKYCYVLLDAVVAGNEELPVLSVEMLNPVDEQRPLVQAVMVVLGATLCWWLYHAAGALAAYVMGALLLGVLPATVALLAISDSWLHALSPVVVGRLIRGLGPTYVYMVAVVVGGVWVIILAGKLIDSQFIGLALLQLVFLAMFCFIGGALFERRVELQLATRTFGERVAEREERYHVEARAAVLDRSFALLRLKRRSEAWANLEPWIREHCPDTHPFTEYHALLTATCGWDDPVIGDRVTDEYVERLLANGETGMALDALGLRLASNPAFYPQTPAYAERLTELATLAGRKAMSRLLVANAAAPRAGQAPINPHP